MPTFLRQRRWLLLLLALYLTLGLAYSLVVPLGEAPDEVEHFRYVQYLLAYRRLPVMLPAREDNYTLEAQQPPLYYLLGAALVSGLDIGDENTFVANHCFSFDPADPGRQNAYLHRREEQFPNRGPFLAFQLLRWLSLILGAGTVLLTYRLGRQLFPADERAAIVATALLAFNPQFIFITASINNDALTSLLGAATVVLAVAANRRPGHWSALGLGLLLGLGVLTKFAGFALAPVALLAVLWPAWRQRAWRPVMPRLAGVASVALLVAGWWYWGNFQLYGDPLIWQRHLAAKGEIIARTTPLTAADLLAFVAVHFQSYWAWFGWMNVRAPDWVYAGLSLMALAAGGGLVRWLRRGARPGNGEVLAFSVLAVLGIYASLFRYIQMINWSGYQGRLAFAVAAPLAMILATGLLGLGGWRLAAGAGLGLLALSIFALPAIIWPAYPRPAIFQPGPELATLGPACARFAGGWQLEAVAADEWVQPGDELQVTLYGFGLATSDGRQQAEVLLYGRDGQVAGRAEGELSWAAGQVVSTTLLLPVAAGARPARAVLQAGLPAPGGSWQPATSATGRVLDVPVGLQTVKIAPPEPFAPRPQHLVEAAFGQQMALMGYDLAGQGQSVNLTLYWQALAPMSDDYTTFIHLLDGAGRLVAQADGQPQEGGYPTAVWDVGEMVADPKTLAWPAELPAGPYTLQVGVYLLPAGERLPLDGSDPPADTFLLSSCTALESCIRQPPGGSKPPGG